MASENASAEAPRLAHVHALKGAVKDYAWGIRGPDSRVARYALESGAIEEIDFSAPYAELWLGTHYKGPSILEDGTSLEEAVGRPLPFLFKILSAGKALSIQAHPDVDNAQRLHDANPDKYPDANHKPEMAIALTPFEAMCGFRRIEEIAVLLRKHPEFAACISPEAKLAVFMSQTEDAKREALKAMFESFMKCPPDVASANLQKLLHRLQEEQNNVDDDPHSLPPWERKCCRAIIRLAGQFHNDPGAMAPLFLNYLLIAPGESFFMAPNEPHAYVAGEIIECMACSDNVVRAGLTPKFKDVDNLVNLLTYTMGGPMITAGAFMEDPRIVRYTPPVPEFEVLICTCDPAEELTLPRRRIPSIMIVIEGTGAGVVHSAAGPTDELLLRPGRSFFIEADAPPLTLKVGAKVKGSLKVAIAHENLHPSSPTSKVRKAAYFKS